MKRFERVLILKDAYNDFEKYYLEKLNSICDSYYFYNSSGFLRKVWTKFKLPFERVWYGKWKKDFDKYDIIIVFDCIKSSKLIKYIHKKSNCRIVYWHWNPISPADEQIVKEVYNICENWTFNPVDAQRFNMRLNNQFYFWQENSSDLSTPSNKVLFVGVDKGRKQYLINLADNLINMHINIDFYLVGDDCGDLTAKGIHMLSQYMSYSEVISKANDSAAIVELVQKGQIGLTVRTLEALFLHKKLITNNQDIINYPFYRKDNIFILGFDKIESIAHFIKSPYIDNDYDTLYPYSAEGWLSEFLEKKNGYDQ